ncbi:MAG: porin [Methylovirgula sp.]|uniref:OprO/OprP family phosphate-selective porin n=1 Tax=Methylovirgula sp. TaxID=1978224 RepID=UPI003076459A
MNNNTFFRHRVRYRGVGTSLLCFLMATSVLAGGASQAFADDSASIHRLEAEIQRIEARHQQEIGALRAEIHHLRHREGGPIYVNKDEEPGALLPHVIESEKGPVHFGFASGDGQNTVELTGRLHIDTGGYLDTNRNTTSSGFASHGLASGINFRRARIGVQGIFLGDWAYGLIFDLGGSSDGYNGGEAQNSGTSTSGIENAFITYNGFYKHGGPFPVAFDIGAIDVPWTLDEPNGSNDIMFMERSSSQVIATAFGGGDNRTALGFRSNNDRYWVGAYLTGPTTGQLHTTTAYSDQPAANGTGEGLGPQFAALFRATYNPYQDKASNASVHLGFNFADTFDPRSGGAPTGTGAGAWGEGFSLSDRPELRVDPTAEFGSTIPAHGGQVFGAEAAATYENFYIQGEYYHYIVDTRNSATAFAATNGPAVGFNGGYVQTSYTFGGRRYYKPTTGAYSGVIPDRPFIFGTGGWGALEVAGRFSIVDLNAAAPYLAGAGGGAGNAAGIIRGGTAAAAILGGEQTSYGAGLNWYPNNNIKFMLDYEHVIEDLPATLGGPNTRGGTIDWIAARSQVVF